MPSGLRELDVSKQAFCVIEVVVGDGTHTVRPFTVTGDEDGQDCICLFSEQIFADRAVSEWEHKGNVLPLDSPNAIANMLDQFCPQLGIRHVAVDWQPESTGQKYLVTTVEKVMYRCRKATGGRSH